MAPTSSSSSSSRGPSDRKNGSPSDGLQPPVSSLSAPSRPRSLLNVPRSSALSPSLSSYSPLNQISTSSSSHSIVSNGTRNGATNGYSALNRLKRVASNASIASSSKVQQLQQKMGISTPLEPVEGDDIHQTPDSASTIALESEEERGQIMKAPKLDSTMKQSDRLAPPTAGLSQQSSNSQSGTLTKRQRPYTANANNNQAKRRTWFGFGGIATDDDDDDDDDDVTMTEAKADSSGLNQSGGEQASNIPDKEDGGVMMSNVAEESTQAKQADQATTMPPKSWVPWRGPIEATAEASDAPLSYTDTIRRYVSAASTQNTSWSGWPLWRSETNEQVSPSDADMVNEEGDKDAIISAASENEQGQQSKSEMSQPSILSRWWPAWSAEQDSSKDRQDVKAPPTPAEQIKADALARMGAKDAVLNEATRSTWINYFSSRSALPSFKVEDKDRGPEVMKIEFPSSQQTKTVQSYSSTQQQASVQSSTNGKGKETGPSSSEKKENKKESIDKAKVDPAPPISRPSTPLTTNKDVAKQVVKGAAAAAAATRGKKAENPTKPPKGLSPPPNLLLPSFDDTFTTTPRSTPPSKGMLEKTLSYLFSRPSEDAAKARARKSSLLSIGASRGESRDDDTKEHEAQARLPRMWSVVGDKEKATSKGCKGVQKVAIIGIHGWFSQGPLRNLFGEPTGTSVKFATMMSNAVKEHFEKAGQAINDAQISVIALEADGQVADRVNKSFSALLNHPTWLADVLSADVVFIAAHSQGCIVATHLLARLIEQRHLNTTRTKVALLAMCGIHQGPFAHLRGSVATYYFNTFETPAAKELFEYQNSKSPVSLMYAAALRIMINAGVKLIYVASMDDQVVPLYSALNISASHPSILRAIFCDGAAFPRVDFLTNLLSFCASVRNAGLSDHNLLTLLSASVAGSLYGGAGHSIVYDESQVYSLAVRYLLEVTSITSYPTTKTNESQVPRLIFEPFSTMENAKWNSNPFALPWSLRGLLEDPLVRKYFDPTIDKLLKDYNDWAPVTKTLKDVQFRLEPMRLVSRQSSPSTNTTATAAATPSTSKL